MHSDYEQPGSNDGAERRVDNWLCQKIPAKPPRAIIDSYRRAMKVIGADQTDHAVAQVFFLQQGKDRNDEHDPEGRNGRQRRGKIAFGEG
jgi:hypothetical protein